MDAKTYRKYARQARENADIYAGFAYHSRKQAAWWFKQRGPVDGTGTWGEGEVRRYDYCRSRFLEEKRNIAFWSRLAVSNLLSAQKYEKAARGVKS